MNPIVWFRMCASSFSQRLDTSLSINIYFPLVGVSRQPSIFISVDLPDPDFPMIATNSPSSIEREILLSAITLVSLLL